MLIRWLVQGRVLQSPVQDLSLPLRCCAPSPGMMLTSRCRSSSTASSSMGEGPVASSRPRVQYHGWSLKLCFVWTQINVTRLEGPRRRPGGVSTLTRHK